MSRLHEILADDTNQFGPGTDLTISLLAVMLVVAMITNHLYEEQKKIPPKPCPPIPKPAAAPAPVDRAEGSFRPASEYFTAADFHAYPVTRLVNSRATAERIERIVREYRRLNGQYPYIFVIGHSSQLDDPRARDQSVEARRKRNLEYALRRSALIAGKIQEQLDASERDRLVAVTTGEADLRDPQDPLSQENAWVEVMFGKEWKPPYRRAATGT